MDSIRISCIRERREIENLCNEKARLEDVVNQFKNNNEDYNKIKQTAEEKVKDVLTNNKLLLKFAALSVIESLRMNPELCNVVLYNISTNTYGSNYVSLISGQQQLQHSFNDTYTALILEESEKLYNQLITEFTNRVMVAAAGGTNNNDI